MVRNTPSNAGDSGLIHGWTTKSLHALGQLSPHATAKEPTRCNYNPTKPHTKRTIKKKHDIVGVCVCVCVCVCIKSNNCMGKRNAKLRTLLEGKLQGSKQPGVKLPSGSSPPFYAKQRTLSPEEKKWTLRLICPAPSRSSLWPISRIPCPSCVRENYSEQP